MLKMKNKLFFLLDKIRDLFLACWIDITNDREKTLETCKRIE